MARLHVRIKDDLHRWLKIEAAKSEMSIQELIELAVKGLKRMSLTIKPKKVK